MALKKRASIQRTFEVVAYLNHMIGFHIKCGAKSLHRYSEKLSQELEWMNEDQAEF